MTRMTNSEAFVETLAAHGVKDIFGIVGSAYMDALDIFPPAGIRFISTAHEQGAAHMADGYARACGRHGLCIAQNGPGITNFVTAIAAAYWAHSPVVMITPESGTTTFGLGGFQETEQLPIFSKITKYQAHLNNPTRMSELLGNCFNRALTDMGPAQFNVPRDYFYGENDTKINGPLTIERGAGGEDSLDRAADLLASARFPVIIAGGGLALGGGIDQGRTLAEYLGAPVVVSYLHNDAFPCDHPLWCGPLGYQGSKAGMQLLAEADVVLALGSRLGPFGTLPQHGLEYWPQDAKLIQVDINPHMLGLVKAVAVPICGDAGAAALRQRLAKRQPACLGDLDSRRSRIEQCQRDWETELDNWGQDEQRPGEAIAPRRALRELERAMPAQAMVSTDIGNICSVANSYLRFREARSFFAAMTFGNCGYALPAIIGAKAAAPDRPAIAYVGDGAWAMSMVEIMTCVREKIPVTAVIFRNNQWGAEKKNQIDYYGDRFVGSNLESPSFADIGRSMGAEGILVEKAGDIGDALRTACDYQRDDKTTVIEICCTRELGDPFRRDALRKPVRLLPKYRDFV